MTINYSEIGRACVGPGGAPYSRHHINEVLNRRRRCSRSLADQLIACGVILSRRQVRESQY